MPISNIRTGFDGDNPSCSVEIADAAGNNRKLVAMITQERTPASITAPTFNSVTGTLVASISETGSTNNLHILVYEWNDSGTNGIASLPSSAGTYTLLTGGVSAEIAVSGISCSGAKQTACVVPSPATVSGLSNADDPSFTISAASGSLALMCIVDNTGTQTLTKGANQVDILASTNSGNARHASSYNTTDSTVSYTRTSTTNYAAAACAIEPDSASGLSITSVDTDNAVLAGQSQATFAGTGLASTAKFAVKRGSAIAYGAAISLSGSTGGSFTAPTMTAMFSAGVRFGDVAFFAAETSGTAIASISGSITTATNWKYVNVTDLSATGSMGSLFYNNAVSLSDQVAYSSVTTRFRWPVTVSGDGYFTVNSSGSQAGDEFAYRIWDETDSTWGTEGTIEVNGGISSAEQVYAAGSLVQASLESSTLEGATLQ